LLELAAKVPLMRCFLTLLLTAVVFFSGLAQAFDLHDQSGCADSSNSTLSDPATPSSGDAPDLHASGCCFGSMVLSLPAGYSALPVTSLKVANGSASAPPPTWYTDAPERPPRS
jgi:hypothetical protein